ncbi:fatty acid alpha-hydroxylase [Gamsiella multidivaricata]|nr:fatty acid alpha-hydroxylase [Gamsiella multidivaricata]
MAVHTYSRAEVLKHKGADSCWVIHNNKIYDVTSFAIDHPGGDEFILGHAGQDITLIMKDELSHFHSEGAYEMLDDFLIGVLEAPAASATTTTSVTLDQTSNFRMRSTATATVTTKTNSTATTSVDGPDEDAYLKPTDLTADKKTKFLDLSQPLLWQLWNARFTKAFYLEQVHIPRHLSGPARIFASPYLEVFTKTPWYMIPIFWLPVIAYNFYRSRETGLGVDQASTLLRLVMPPALAVALAIPINKLAHTLLVTPKAYAVMSGLLLGYVLYDMTHYYLHHARVFKIHFKEMKTYHLAHHYKNYVGGYGITSKIWDKIFNTELQL